MATPQFQFSLRTPVTELYNAPVDLVHLATDEGEMEVLPGHASTVGTIQFSKIVVTSLNHTDSFLVRQGILTVDENGTVVRILATDAHKQSDMRLRSLEEYRTFILDRLKEPERLSKYQMRFLSDQQASIEKSIEVFRTDETKNS